MAYDQSMWTRRIRSGWLLWMAAGTTCTLTAYGWPPVFSVACGSFWTLVWICINLSTRMLICNFLNGCVDVFFRQVAVAGAHKLNFSDEPLLLAIAPHANQFIDPMIILKTFERPVGFLCAAKSMRYTRGPSDVIAFFANGIDSVPVERPQDIAKIGKGFIEKVKRSDERVVVHGSVTTFLTSCRKGDSLMVTKGPCKGSLAKILEVVSDTLAVVADSAFTGSDASERSTYDTVSNVPFKVLPKVDQDQVYQGIYSRLDANGCVGIFPEGGSHDRASLLPLKAGIAVMALGACKQHGEALRKRLRVVAVGLNYFSGHRFRSRVFVDYGEPFEVSRELVERYASGDKRGAGDELMAQILTAVKAVTVQAPDSATAETFWMLRRLYVPDGKRLSLEEKVALTRGFADAVKKDRDDPDVSSVLKKVEAYHHLLKHYSLHDRQVTRAGADTKVLDRVDALMMLAFRISLILTYAVAILPGMILASPLLVISEVVSRYKAKVAVAGSRVKLKGRDILATWKVVCGMVLIPALHAFYTVCVYCLYSSREAVAYFFFMPFVSYTSIIASENAYMVLKSIGPLFMLLTKRQTGLELREMRRLLKRDVRDLALKLGWAEIIRNADSHQSFGTMDQGASHVSGFPRN